MSLHRLENLSGKVAVIAGGAGQVGSATAYRLADQGARVVALVRRNLEAAQALMQSLPSADSLGHLALLASITDSASLAAAADQVRSRFGHCDILVNAAGTTCNIKPAQLDELTDEIFDEIVRTNLRGVFATIRAFAPLLKASGDGLIVNISSTAGLRASDSNLAYASAKAGVDLMTKTLAKALAPKVRVVAVAPGYLVKPTSGAVKAPGFNEKMAAVIPLNRIGEADDIASTIEACATTLRYATGITLVVDGGRTL